MCLFTVLIVGNVCCNVICFHLIVQEAWDLARRISCPTSERSNGKTVYFKPITVDMLDVVSVSAEPGTIDCWMDIQKGQYPRVSSHKTTTFNPFNLIKNFHSHTCTQFDFLTNKILLKSVICYWILC